MFRPDKQSYRYFGDYVIDHRNILDWSSPIRAFDLIIGDFKKVCEYIDPSDDNCAVYSHRLYELFIRSCTELESNMKAILNANGYKTKTKIAGIQRLNINDYKKLETALKLSEYQVIINFWNNGRGSKHAPFQNWANGESGNLVWYQDYNYVKHDRDGKFHLASLENLISSICGLFVILFSQYGVQVFNPYQKVESYDSWDKTIYEKSSIFSIIPPVWQDGEEYDFNWDIISKQKDPFVRFKSFDGKSKNKR